VCAANDAVLIPFAFDTKGATNDEFRTFIDDVAETVKNRHDEWEHEGSSWAQSSFRWFWMTAISCKLHRELGQALTTMAKMSSSVRGEVPRSDIMRHTIGGLLRSLEL
jgi:hypothetical protein